MFRDSLEKGPLRSSAVEVGPAREGVMGVEVRTPGELVAVVGFEAGDALQPRLERSYPGLRSGPDDTQDLSQLMRGEDIPTCRP